jgi:2-C-methyl-D-erythritol 2,4-cyclodiphosphate synthase
LGALGEPDIGQLFPPSEEQWKNASSELFLKEAIRRMEMANYKILNLDCVIICDQPKIAPYKEKIIRSLGDLLKIHPWQISIKGKTREGFCSEEGIAVFCNVLLQKIQPKDV